MKKSLKTQNLKVAQLNRNRERVEVEAGAKTCRNRVRFHLDRILGPYLDRVQDHETERRRRKDEAEKRKVEAIRRRPRVVRAPLDPYRGQDHDLDTRGPVLDP